MRSRPAGEITIVVLSIRDEVTGRLWRVWPDPEPIAAGSVRETGSYLFELRDSGETAGADLLIDDAPLEALRSTDPRKSRWRWSPGFHAGTVEAELRLPGSGTRRFEIVTDPDLRKLTRSDFNEMVREILEDTFALFSLSGFRKCVARGTGGRPPAIARLEFLRSRVDELEIASRAVARNPRRMLTSEDTAVRYPRAVRATGTEILRSFRSGRILPETWKPSRLPPSLNGFLPERIRLRRRRSSLDLAEHRQMASCLRAWSSWLTAAADLLEHSATAGTGDVERNQAGRTWAARCRLLARRVGRLTELPPFAESGESPPRLVLSSVFRNDPVYRRFFGLYRDINLGIAAVFGDFLGMPLARTFELYELWCFLRLVRAATDEYGATDLDVGNLFISDASGGVTVAAGAVTVSVGSGWKLCFQKQYREFWLEQDGRGSFSRAMKPDVVMVQDEAAGENNSRLIVLDAKYRIDDGLNEALNSIHTYRDALVRESESGDIEGVVTAAYLLTPYLPGVKEEYRKTPLPGRLFHPEYRRSFRFGATTLRPGMTADDLRAAVRMIVADATN